MTIKEEFDSVDGLMGMLRNIFIEIFILESEYNFNGRIVIILLVSDDSPCFLVEMYLSIISGRGKLSSELREIMDTVCFDYMITLINEPFDGDRSQPVSVNQKILGFVVQA